MVTRAHHNPMPPLNAYVSSLGGSPIRSLLSLAQDPDIISFGGGAPASESFDVEGIGKSYQRVLEEHGPRALQYSSTEGEPELRRAVAERMTYNGLYTEADDVLITSGSQQGLGLIGQVVLDPDSIVLTENPTFVSALQAFALSRAQFRPVDTDSGGLVPEALEAAILQYAPRAVYLIPTFQNPTGVTMPESRRREVADVLARYNVWLIEDDPYSELRYDEWTMTPISADPRLTHKSLYLGTLSKVMAPGLRIGWVRGPQEALDTLATTKQGTSLQTSTIDQLAAVDWLEHNDLDAKLVPIRAEYRRRRDAMVEGLDAVLPEGYTLNTPMGGMFLWATLPEPFDASESVMDAVRAGVVYIPGMQFYVADPKPSTLRLSFVSNPVDVIAQGLERLRTVFR